MSKRIKQEINAGSMADIAFLLLIFFLVTTTMGTDMGIVRKLPPDAKEDFDIIVHKRDLLDVWVNRDNKLMVKGKLIELSELKNIAKEFIQNPNKHEDLPEVVSMYIPEIGEVEVTAQHVISLISDRGTTYKTYIAVQNQLAIAYSELREELSRKVWGRGYDDVSDRKRKAVEKVYPLRISEAEPMNLALTD